MKPCLLLLAAILLYASVSSQKLKTGTYTFRFCDLEYNSCVGDCKVVIRGDSITVYATKKLAATRTFTKEGDVIDRGIIIKHKTGKWIIGKTKKDVNAENLGVEGPNIIDFTKKQFWTF
jgi:hypothetical protein